MNEDHQVTQCDHQFGRVKHRSVTIKRCANGYIAEYQIVNPSRRDGDIFDATISERRVFICNADLMEFIADYFNDEPKL